MLKVPLSFLYYKKNFENSTDNDINCGLDYYNSNNNQPIYTPLNIGKLGIICSLLVVQIKSIDTFRW